jgi:hypothetical protein
MRWAACLVGALILSAVAHVNVAATGGYGTAHSYLALAIAAGVALGAVVIGKAWSERRRGLAALLVIAICAGEAYGFIATAERLIASREATQAPLRFMADDRAQAEQRVASAIATVEAVSRETPRLKVALEAKAQSDLAVVQKSAERGCAENCRKLLQAQANAAAHEVEDARAEMTRERTSAETELNDARATLDGIKPPTSATPLADRIGWPSWVVDLVHSALGSIAANGLACALLAFGAHHNNRLPVERPKNLEKAAEPKRRPANPTLPFDPHVDHAAAFAVARLEPAQDGGADLADVYRAYRSWCRAAGLVPLAQREIGDALLTLFKRAQLPICLIDGRPAVRGAILRPEATITT